MFKKEFFKTLNKHSNSAVLANELWNDVIEHYSKSHRKYHNLDHLDHITSELQEVKAQILKWEIVVFAIAYHDIIYNVISKNNEEQSANHAEEKLSLVLPLDDINHCKKMILATKSHEKADDNDVNYFTDADLAILGSSPAIYNRYRESIRKEFHLIPSFIYNTGRKKFLAKLLEKPAIYNTSFFQSKYEAQARRNIEAEMKDYN